MEEEKKTEDTHIVENTDIEAAKIQAGKDRMAKARAARAMKKADTTLISETAIPDEKKAPAVHVKSSDVVFFSEVDMNDMGKVVADLPAFCFPKQLETLKEEIDVLEMQIEDGLFKAQKKRDAYEKLEKMKQRRDAIEEFQPKIQGFVKDKIAKSFKALGENITATMYSESDMWSMKADAHKEATRMKTPCVKIPDEVVASFVKQHGRMPIKDGMLSRDNACIVWKTMAHTLGEESNCERLRPSR